MGVVRSLSQTNNTSNVAEIVRILNHALGEDSLGKSVVRVSSLLKQVSIVVSELLTRVLNTIDTETGSWVRGIGGATEMKRTRKSANERSFSNLLKTRVDLTRAVRKVNLVNILRSVRISMRVSI